MSVLLLQEWIGCCTVGTQSRRMWGGVDHDTTLRGKVQKLRRLCEWLLYLSHCHPSSMLFWIAVCPASHIVYILTETNWIHKKHQRTVMESIPVYWNIEIWFKHFNQFTLDSNLRSSRQQARWPPVFDIMICWDVFSGPGLRFHRHPGTAHAGDSIGWLPWSPGHSPGHCSWSAGAAPGPGPAVWLQWSRTHCCLGYQVSNTPKQIDLQYVHVQRKVQTVMKSICSVLYYFSSLNVTVICFYFCVFFLLLLCLVVCCVC